MSRTSFAPAAAAVAMIAAALAACQPGRAAEPAGARAAAAEPARTGTNGIEVHGHWKVTVRDPDGGDAHTTEFENSLQAQGAIALTTLLSGADTLRQPQPWGIFIDDSNSVEISTTNNAVAPITVTHDGLQGTITLLATLRNPTTGALAQVATVSTTMTLTGTGSYLFTRATPPSIPLMPGQIVEITVTFSFS